MGSTDTKHPRRHLRALLAAAALCGCGGGGSAHAPQASLAQSRDAQQDFRELHKAWISATDVERVSLAPSLADFLRRHPNDRRARVVRVYLAWLHIQKGDLARARALVAETRGGPEGSAHDFATVAEAAIEHRAGHPDRALLLLEPLAGKIVDPDERFLYGEQRVRAGLAVGRGADAVRFMLDWLAAAPPEDREAVQERILAMSEPLDNRAFESVLTELDEQAESVGAQSRRAAARDWMRKTLRKRLVVRALRDGDSALARRLLAAKGVAWKSEDRIDELARLAARGTILPRVQGRQVGLVLSMGSEALRRRSAEVAKGMSRALGLPSSAANPESVRLLTSDDGGDSEGLSRSLRRLAGEGAAILVAGVDREGADAATSYARSAKIPVIVLHAATHSASAKGFAFELGVDTQAARPLLLEALAARGITRPAVVGTSDAVSCYSAAAAGQARFPVQQWRQQGIDGLVLMGDESCSREVLRETKQAGLALDVALGLESAQLAPHVSRPVVTASAGRFPLQRDIESDKWTGAERPSWYAALGHDAALLAASALASFPLERIDDVKSVAELHREARDGLAEARATLWTSDAKGFAGARRLTRALGLQDTKSER